ncbi:MAG: nitroreductase/quinone reductase family protein [Dehalococcoidia bacterium]
MNDDIQQALKQDHTDHDRTIDITTSGRKTGLPRRTEIWFHNLDGRIYITGTPGHRDWLANLLANPEFTFHLKSNVQADLPARARPIMDSKERREVMSGIIGKLEGDRDLDEWVQSSPLVEVEFQVE